jgi:hypothetical protein
MKTPLRLLLLGKRPDVMQRLLADVRAAGFQAEGSTDISTAPQQFDARQFDLIGLGGGVEPHERELLADNGVHGAEARNYAAGFGGAGCSGAAAECGRRALRPVA